MHTKLTTAASRPGHRAGTDRTRATHTLLRLLARRVQSLQGFWLATLRDDAELEQAVKVVTNKMSFDQAMELVCHPERRGQTPSLSVSLLRFVLALAFALALALPLFFSLPLSLSLARAHKSRRRVATARRRRVRTASRMLTTTRISRHDVVDEFAP